MDHRPGLDDSVDHFAIRTTVLRTQVGSGVHGVTLAGTDDRDEMGVCIEPIEQVIRVGKPFEQFTHRTQPEGVRSGPGDLDLVIYSLRKWLRLALAGNPTVLLPLFVPDSEVMVITDTGRWLREHRDVILSRRAGARFLGYLHDQRQRMDLPSRATHGYDTKAAYHMLRLGMQGCELLATGAITLPMSAADREYLLTVRRGERSRDWVRIEAVRWEAALRRAIEVSVLPAEPNAPFADAWLADQYLTAWSAMPRQAGR
jgi:hypothetical protein